MGKSKAEKRGDGGVQQRHVHSRLSYLHQAATYLSTASHEARTNTTTVKDEAENASDSSSPLQQEHGAAESRQFLTQISEISQKSQIRVTPDMKRSFCKRCRSLLIAGSTSRESVHNASLDEAKPWADVFEISCNTCRTVKRFPIGQRRIGKSNKKDKRVAARSARQQTGVAKGVDELK